MPNVRLHAPCGRLVAVVRVASTEHPPTVVLWQGAVYVDRTRSRQDYYEAQAVEPLCEVELEPEPAVERVAGQHTSGTGV